MRERDRLNMSVKAPVSYLTRYVIWTGHLSWVNPHECSANLCLSDGKVVLVCRREVEGWLRAPVEVVAETMKEGSSGWW